MSDNDNKQWKKQEPIVVKVSLPIEYVKASGKMIQGKRIWQFRAKNRSMANAFRNCDWEDLL